MIFNEGVQNRLQMRRQRRVQQSRLGDPLAITSGLISADEAAVTNTATRSVIVGVCTGVSVWLVTRILDRIFGIERRK